MAITKTELAKLNAALRGKAPAAIITDDGQLWVRARGYGETMADLEAQMDSADAYLASKGYARDASQPIFRRGIDFGQAICRA